MSLKPTTYGQASPQDLQNQSESLEALSKQQAETLAKRQGNRLDPGIGQKPGDRAADRAESRRTPQFVGSKDQSDSNQPETVSSAAAQATVSHGIPEHKSNSKMKFYK